MDYRVINWLASYPKSGNTWVRMFLDAYFLEDVDINEVICSVPDDLTTRHLVGDGSDPKTFPIDIQALTRPMALLRLVRQYNLNTAAKPPLYVKTHNANMIANGIELLPFSLTKSTLYLVRDPRDVVLSFAKHMGKDIDTAVDLFLDKYRVLSDDVGYKMGDFISSWQANVTSYLNNDTHNIMWMKYEDLKAYPEEAFSKILRHSGVEPEKDRVLKAIELTELSKLQRQEKEKGFRESSPYAENKFFGKGEIGGWKGKLSPAHVRRIEKECGSVMKRIGYIEKRKVA